MTAVMLPAALELGRARDIPPSRLLRPLSFAASLGTTITVIGAPALLIASGLLQQAGRPGFGLFAYWATGGSSTPGSRRSATSASATGRARAAAAQEAHDVQVVVVTAATRRPSSGESGRTATSVT